MLKRLLAIFFLLVPSQLLVGAESLKKTALSLSPLVPPDLSSQEQLQAGFGELIFHDTRFSRNGKVSCASCHQPGRYFTDGRKTGFGLSAGSRNTPTVVNSFAITRAFWDGRADSLISQSLGPLENHREHGISRLEVFYLIYEYYRTPYEKLFGKIPVLDTKAKRAKPQSPIVKLPVPLVELFQKQRQYLLKNTRFSLSAKAKAPRLKLESDATKLYNDLKPSDRAKITRLFANVGIAIAAFERTVVAVNSPFDRFVAQWEKQKKPPLSPDFDQTALAGFKLFVGKAGCINCHHGKNFTDNQFHNIGINRFNNPDFGRALGLQLAKHDVDFGCNSDLLSQVEWLQNNEACAEKPFLSGTDSSLLGAFKTPSLRNVAETAPYFHDGSAPTLKKAIEHYRSVFGKKTMIGHRSESLVNAKLSDAEIDQLSKFLQTLTAPVMIKTKSKDSKIETN